jgi:hypothetical protein
MGREADHSPPSNAEVKNVWNYTLLPQYTVTACYSVKKAQEQLCFTYKNLLFADNHIILVRIGKNLQRDIYNIYNLIRLYDMKNIHLKFHLEGRIYEIEIVL